MSAKAALNFYGLNKASEGNNGILILQMMNQEQRNVLTSLGTTQAERENEHTIPKSHTAIFQAC